MATGELRPFCAYSRAACLVGENLLQPSRPLAGADDDKRVGKVSSLLFVFTLRSLLRLLSHSGVGIVHSRCAVLMTDKIFANFFFSFDILTNFLR